MHVMYIPALLENPEIRFIVSFDPKMAKDTNTILNNYFQIIITKGIFIYTFYCFIELRYVLKFTHVILFIKGYSCPKKNVCTNGSKL